MTTEKTESHHASPPLRILRICHSSLTPALRERERAFARLYPNVELEVVTADRWREAEQDVEATDDDLFRVTKSRPHLSKHLQLFAYGPRPIIDALCRHRPHLIDFNHEPYSVACAELLTVSRLFANKTPIVIQTNQNILRSYPPPFSLFERRALRRISAAYACSETVREVMRAKGFDKPIPIIPFGVNADIFYPSENGDYSDRQLTIGYVGRLMEGKGVRLLVAALSRLAAKSWRLLIVGDGPRREIIEHELNEACLRGRVEFTGAVGYERVAELYRKLDMVVMPTRTTNRIREQFGRVIIEAMASGVPVIGSTCGAIPEVIGDAGIVFPQTDVEALTDAINKLINDPSLRQRLARAGRARIEEHYTWERVAEKTYELYRQVLRRERALALNRALELVA